MAKVFKSAFFYIFLLLFIYWGYLLSSSQMTIQYDSINYEKMGQLFAQGEWIKYFKTGPNREPAYPLLISISMKIADLFAVSYQKIIAAFQILILFFTQILSLKILKRLHISKIWCAFAILYIGISPALVNSALSLYSEIVVYPFLLGIILFAVAARQGLCTKTQGYKVFFYATGFSLCFVLSTLTKAIFELIFPIFLIPFITVSLHSLLRKNFSAFKNSLMFLATALIIFYSAISGYKWLNKTYNGQFVITDRGAWALYGNTDRRMAPLSFKRFLVALAYVPGEGVCRKLFNEKECAFWSFRESDGRGYAKSSELSQTGMNDTQVNQELMRLATQRIAQNPAQYLLFVGLEGLKMLFWESTQIGFVTYPNWLQGLFAFGPFKDGLRLMIFLLTLSGIFYSTVYILKNRWALTDVQSQNHQDTGVLFFVLFMIFVYIGLYSFFFTLTRYSLPIAPLFVILIAFISSRNLIKLRK